MFTIHNMSPLLLRIDFLQYKFLSAFFYKVTLNVNIVYLKTATSEPIVSIEQAWPWSLEICIERIFNNLIKQNQKLVLILFYNSQKQCPRSRVQSPASSVQRLESRVQSPASRVHRLDSRVQHPQSSFQSPVSNSCVQGPGIPVWRFFRWKTFLIISLEESIAL